MNIAVISLIAVIVAVAISCVSKRNIGVLCMAFAFLIAHFLGGEELTVKQLAGFWNTGLFITLFGVIFLFTMAQNNGTLEKIAKWSVKLTKGSIGLIPIVFFFLTVFISAVGPGNIVVTMLMAPIAMALSAETRISPVLMTLMVVNGANAGALSPFAPSGILAADLAVKIGIADAGLGSQLFINSLLGNGIIAVLGYVLFGGLKLWGKRVSPELKERVNAVIERGIEPWDRNQKITIVALAVLVVAVLGFKLNVGYSAMLLAIVISFVGAADEAEAFKKMPWSTIFMVLGVLVLVSAADKLGGLDYATSALASISTSATVSAMFGFLSGFVSIYSGTTTVVMPAFIPLIPGIVAKLSVTGPEAIILGKNLLYACCVCGMLVDASPLSSLGAMHLANAPEWQDKTKMYRDLLIWGFAMSIAGALVSLLLWR